MKILVLNGPNLNLLDKRDKEIYGSLNLWDIENSLKKEFPKTDFYFIQSNLEGELVNNIQEADRLYDGLVINPGGYAHTSVAILDALALCKIPKVEVHLSNLAGREDYRKNLITAKYCDGYISGLKEISYLAAAYSVLQLIKR